MRLYLKLTKNKEIIPFNYQHLLTGAIHKWIGEENKEHGDVSLYSFSWLQKANTNNKGIILTRDSYFFISTFKDDLLKAILKGVLENPFVCWGSEVYDAQIMETPEFGTKEHFLLASPVFIKKRFDDKQKHIAFNDELSGKYMTETMSKKLSVAEMSSEGLSIEFDKNYPNPKTKLIHYNEIKNKANICPVIIEGSSEQLAFAWNVGVGNSTGIGFGSLK
jgi:CRISPR-associated endoribonuclease Cas6